MFQCKFSLIDLFSNSELFPSHFQRAVLEPALKGQDLIARAKTGTGKTLAFGIPILDRTIKEQEKRIRFSNDKLVSISL